MADMLWTVVAVLMAATSAVAPIVAIVVQVFDVYLSHPLEFWVVDGVLWAGSWGYWAGAIMMDE